MQSVISSKLYKSHLVENYTYNLHSPENIGVDNGIMFLACRLLQKHIVQFYILSCCLGYIANHLPPLESLTLSLPVYHCRQWNS